MKHKTSLSDTCRQLTNSPTPSMITVSSTNSFRETNDRRRSGSTTASNSDLDEGLAFNSAPNVLSRFHPSPGFSTTNGNVIVVNADSNPALAGNSRVAINNSTEVQVATNIYNGPVTILRDDISKLDRPVALTIENENGVIIEGFEGKSFYSHGESIP